MFFFALRIFQQFSQSYPSQIGNFFWYLQLLIVHNVNIHIAIITGIIKILYMSSRTTVMIINKGVPVMSKYPAPLPISRINKGDSHIIHDTLTA